MASHAQTTTKLLDIHNLSVDYFAENGTVHAVRDVSLSLGRGEILGLAGESGCGKSTLAYAISRLLRPPAYITGGKVLYYPPFPKSGKTSPIQLSNLPRRGRNNSVERDPDAPIDVLQLSPAQLRSFRWNEMSIVFQSAMNSLNPVMSVGAQIMDVLKTHQPERGPDSRKKRAIELLDLVGIAADRLNSYPHELSGGMRQRAVIAIALALNPELIIMDEPTTALDVVVQREILQLISALCKEFSTALIFITHDLSLLLELADHIAIMYAGKVIEKASSENLYQHPRHPYSYGLLNSFPKLHGPQRRMVGIPGSPPDLRAIPPGCPFNPRCPFAFSACHTTIPPLAPDTRLPTIQISDKPSSRGKSIEQLVACHLYDPQYNASGPPAANEFAARFESLAERGAVQ